MAEFLLSAAPYIIVFFAIVLIAIIVLKILINHREKKLSNQPQKQNRFDLEEFEDMKNDTD